MLRKTTVLLLGALLGGSLAPAPMQGAELVSIQVFPRGSIPPGSAFGFGAIGTYSDGTSRDITRKVKLVSSHPAAAPVLRRNVVAGVAPGTSVISATLKNVTSTRNATLTVSPITALAITPGEDGIRLGSRVRFGARATLADGTDGLDVTHLVEWESLDPGVVSMANKKKSKGLSRALALGTATLRITLPGTALFADKEVSVVENLQSVEVTPDFLRIQPGGGSRFRAIGLFEGGVEAEVTFDSRWFSSDTSIAKLDKSGRSKVRALGSVDVKAVDKKTAIESSSDGVLEIVGDVASITVEPPALELAVGEEFAYDAIADVVVTEQGTTAPFSWGDRLHWLSTHPDVALPDEGGNVRCEAPGTATIFAIDPRTGRTSADPGGASSALTCD